MEHKVQNIHKSVAGFSLLELIVAMTVTLTIAGIASTLLASSFRLRAREDTRSDAVADAQRALNIVSREIASSGFGLIDNGVVPGDTGPSSIRLRSNLNAYTRDAVTGLPVPGSGTVSEQDEDIKYSMYNDEAANRHYLVRYDVVLGAVDPRDGTTVLANRIDSFQLQYFDANGNALDVVTDPNAVINAWRIRITVGVNLPAEGAPGSPGYQPPTTIQLVSDVVLRNTSQSTY